MGIEANISLRMEVIAILIIMTLLTESYVLAQNETEGNETRTVNTTALFSSGNKPHRSRYEIVNDILKIVLYRTQSPSSLYMCKPLHIAYGAGLTYRQTNSYLALLVESGLLLKKQTKFGPYGSYEITEKGRLYLKVYSELQDTLRPYSEIQDTLRPVVG